MKFDLSRGRHPLEFVGDAVKRILDGDPNGCSHVYFREMSKKDAARLEHWLDTPEHYSLARACTPFARFQALVKQWVERERSDPGVCRREINWHAFTPEIDDA